MTKKRYLTLKRLQADGVLYHPGSIVELTDADARWCIDIGVIEPEPIADGALLPTPVAPLAQPPAAPATVGRRCAGCGWR